MNACCIKKVMASYRTMSSFEEHMSSTIVDNFNNCSTTSLSLSSSVVVAPTNFLVFTIFGSPKYSVPYNVCTEEFFENLFLIMCRFPLEIDSHSACVGHLC